MQENEIYFEEYGDKNAQPIIFINGWGTDHTGLKNASLKYFEKDYRCIFIDALGCGKSSMYKRNSTFICIQNADAIADLIAKLNLKNTIIYGNCLGGWIGALVCMKPDNDIEKLIFIDGYLFFDKEYLPFILPGIRKIFYKFFFQNRLGLTISNHFVGFAQKITDEFIKEQKNINTDVALDYVYDLYKMSNNGFRDYINKIATKSLFIVGEHTLPVINKSCNYWVKNVNGAESEYVSKCSHLTISENPQELNEKIRKFIDHNYEK